MIMRLKEHKIAGQTIFSTTDINININGEESFGTLVDVEPEDADNVFKRPEDFITKKGKLVDKKKDKVVE